MPTTIWSVDLGQKHPAPAAGPVDEDLVLNSSAGTLWRVQVGGDNMTKVSMVVRAKTARRAAQWAIAFVRCAWLNTRRTAGKWRDTRKIWLA